MQRVFIVSDIHITSADEPRARLFMEFLRGLKGRENVSCLILLGDIFDLWIADHRYFVDKYRSLTREIVRLRDEGVEIHYFEGNHDLYLEPYWRDELGIVVHGNPINIELAGQRLRLEHGDQMDPDDRGYLFLRWFLRSPPVRFLVRHLPGWFIVWLGERMSRTSRTYTSEMKTITDEDAIRKIRAHTERAYDEQAFDLIVSGHIHVRDDFTVIETRRHYRSINLGSWLDAPCYLVLDEAGAKLIDMEQPRDPEPGTEVIR
jgi:UDP-2,3-diacylglucosamine hydrolase